MTHCNLVLVVKEKPKKDGLELSGIASLAGGLSFFTVDGAHGLIDSEINGEEYKTNEALHLAARGVENTPLRFYRDTEGVMRYQTNSGYKLSPQAEKLALAICDKCTPAAKWKTQNNS